MELGASHQGEIDYTSNLVQPQVAGILNIGTAHWVSLVDVKAFAVLNRKFMRILPEGTSIVPANDDFTAKIVKLSKRQSKFW
jgi:UDP-N-acetylmuramoyl-tripeptide--D-alanyl-D-alanine ligase